MSPVPSAFSSPPADEFPHMGSNIMNIKAGANSSLYQICTGLRQRLGDVPGFEEHIVEMEEEEEDSADEPKDPVTLMWNCLRRGYPLMTIYNASLPARPLKIDATKIREDKVGKATTFKFLQACMTEFRIPPDECFLITDLFGEDTTGFVKVSFNVPFLGFPPQINTHLMAETLSLYDLKAAVDAIIGDKACEQSSGYPGQRGPSAAQ